MTEIVTWVLASAVVAGVLTAAAWAWERGAQRSGRPARWGWLAALGGSVTLPFVARWLPEQSWNEVVPVGLVQLEALSVATAAAPGPRVSLEELALGAWAVLTLCVVAWVGVVVVRLARARRGWREGELAGARVLVSRNVGPAALGVRRGLVVIPSWALQLDEELQRLMLLHEREHVGAGDPRLLLGALLLAAVMPWNPLVWLQLVRLRSAIELDCDARVLRRGADPARYGALLLEVGLRRGRSPLMLATFAEPRLLLEERIRRIARWPLERRPLRAAALSLVALALFSTALVARVQSSTAPVLPAEEMVREAIARVAEVPLREAAQPLASDTPPVVPALPALRPDPRQTPYTRAPEVRNTEAVVRLLNEKYPARLREAGIGGTAAVWLLVGADGSVQALQLSKPSGYPALDEAALQVASSLQFVPAENNGAATTAWVEVPIAFGPLANSVTVNEQPVRPARQPTRTGNLSDAPTFTPMTARPELRNSMDVQRALVQRYPPLLRDAGIGGTPVVWFFIDENGHVLKTQISRPSGYPALDDAALSVAGMMQFTPARNRDNVVPVWVEIPITFTARSPGEPERVPAESRPRTPAPDGVIALSEIPVTGVRAAPPERQARPAGETRELTVVPRGEQVDPTVVPRSEQAEARVSSGRMTPMTKRPELTNSNEVQRELVRNYPPLLRDAGIGGTVQVWVFVDEEGRVQRLQLSRPSGHQSLDEAALRVASTFRFTPARNGDEIVAVWIELPIVFTAR